MGRKKKLETSQVELLNDQSDTARDPLLESTPKDVPEAGHADRKHALLAPSSAKRWMACPGSVALSLKCPKSEDSAYAAEGTHAHEVSEKILSAWLLDDMDVLPAIEKYKHLFLNAEMEDCVVSYILTIGRLISGKKLDRIAIEKRFILDAELGIFGTADVAFKYKKAGKSIGVIVDLKYGQGVVVEADENPQLACYGCAMDKDSEWGPFDTVYLYIFQPRAEHRDGPLRRMILTREEIIEWRHQITGAGKAAINEIESNALTLNTGDHCQFCPAEGVCSRRMAQLRGDASVDFLPYVEPKISRPGLEVDAHLIDDETLVHIVNKRSEIEAFLKRVEEYVINRHLQNNPLDGLKLVHGRAPRKWIKDEDTVAKGLITLGISDPWKRSLIGITEAEKIVGKNQINALTYKPDPSLKIVSVDDPREAVTISNQAAITDFTEAESK